MVQYEGYKRARGLARLGFMISPLRAPHCAFCTIGYGLLFGLRSFFSFFPFFSSLAGCFFFFYLIDYYLLVHWIASHCWAKGGERGPVVDRLRTQFYTSRRCVYSASLHSIDP